ncbi:MULTISPECIES: hypothetical protein [unclassified Streptomyces]|uniref:hypothetical protein n=1 Tax=unclassified Streptomyces TaxID=2593676 RepID=UPI0037FE800F
MSASPAATGPRVDHPQYTPGALSPVRAAVGRIAVGTVFFRFALRDNGATNQ